MDGDDDDDDDEDDCSRLINGTIAERVAGSSSMVSQFGSINHATFDVDVNTKPVGRAFVGASWLYT